MGYKNREIEIKLLVANCTRLNVVHGAVFAWLCDCYPEHGVNGNSAFSYLYGEASDLYWYTPQHSNGDFVRLRRTNQRAQITMKATDKKDITNRVEIDLEVDDYNQAKILMLGVHGEPVAAVSKKYHVYFLENEDTTVSIYQIENDKRVLIELEATSVERVKEMTRSLLFSAEDLKFLWLKSSVFNMFVQRKEMELDEVSSFLESPV